MTMEAQARTDQAVQIAIRVGQNIKDYRDLASLSQHVVALHIGVDRSTYGRYESGEIDMTVSTLLKIARVLGVEPRRLLVGTALNDEPD